MNKPKYQVIKSMIIEGIQERQPNTPILSEREIASKYSASRMTVRRAIEELCDEGYLYRDKNRGTFIADKQLIKNTKPVIVDETPVEIEYKILYFDIKTESEPDVALNLNLDKHENFLRLIRLTKQGKKNLSVEEVFIARRNVSDENLGQLSAFINIDLFIEQGSTKEIFIPMMVPVQYASLLHLDIKTPIIMVKNIIFEQNGSPFVYIRTYYNPLHKEIIITR